MVFQTGRSLKDVLVSSSLDHPTCPRERYLRKEKKGRGRPVECRACDAGIASGQCMSKNVVYSVFCALCEAEYVGETERTVRERLTEYLRQTGTAAPGTPWGGHYRLYHAASSTSSKSFRPFRRASILARESSHVNRRILEAMFIRERQPSVNNDCGWILLDS